MILVIDNYDSFTYNIVQILGALGQEVKVLRNDQVEIAGVESLAPQAIVISPGPGRPADSGVTCQVIEHFAYHLPILGICLGHQAVGQVFGAEVVRAPRALHGKTSEIFHDGKGLFQGLRNPFVATRYHSLIVPEESLTPPLEVSAFTLEGEIMGLRCKGTKVEGLQFHPESIATAQGVTIFSNFLGLYLKAA